MASKDKMKRKSIYLLLFIAIIFLLVIVGLLAWMNRPSESTPEQTEDISAVVENNEIIHKNSPDMDFPAIASSEAQIIDQVISELPDEYTEKTLVPVYINDSVIVYSDRTVQNDYEYIFSVRDGDETNVIYTGELLPCNLYQEYPIFPQRFTQTCE